MIDHSNGKKISHRLVLASESPWKLQLLERIGYKPDIVVPAFIDESPKKNELPGRLSIRLAIEKATKVQNLFPEDIVLGADTVVAAGRRLMPKAMKEEDAWFCLNTLSGRRHRVYTGVSVRHKNKSASKIVMSVVKFKLLTKEEKISFIDSLEWRGKAGGYGLQGYAAAFIEFISGSDSNIVGIPLSQTYKLLVGFGLYPQNIKKI